MNTYLTQQRVTLTKLKVADFASEETLCFSATVLFDGQPVAEARNDGRGGMTFLLALDGQRARLDDAERFARSLPPASLEDANSGPDAEPTTFAVTLDFLVDHLADTMHADRKLRTAFQRAFTSQVLFIRDGSLCYLKGVKLKDIHDKAAFFAVLRTRFKQPIVILAELPQEEAFEQWKRYATRDKPA